MSYFVGFVRLLWSDIEVSKNTKFVHCTRGKVVGPGDMSSKPILQLSTGTSIHLADTF